MIAIIWMLIPVDVQCVLVASLLLLFYLVNDCGSAGRRRFARRRSSEQSAERDTRRSDNDSADLHDGSPQEDETVAPSLMEWSGPAGRHKFVAPFARLRDASLVPKPKKPSSPTPEERMARMDASFAEDFSVLEEDYVFFTSGAPIRPNKAARTSAEAHARRSPKQS